MKRLLLLFVATLVASSFVSFAPRTSSLDNKYQKATEALFSEDDSDKGIKLVSEKLEDIPHHIDPYFLQVKFCAYHEKYDVKEVLLHYIYHRKNVGNKKNRF